MANPNGLHIFVRPHLGGRFAGRDWIQIPENGVDPEILPYVQPYFGDYGNGIKFLEVNEPTWESVKVEVGRMKEGEKERRAEKTTVFIELANAYLEGGPHTWPTRDTQITVGHDKKSVNIKSLGLNVSSTECSPDPELVAKVIEKYGQLNKDAEDREIEEKEQKHQALLTMLPRILSGEGELSNSDYFILDNKSFWFREFPEAEQILQERQRRLDDAKRKLEEAKRKFEEDETSWIKTQGSPRLLKAYAVGAHYQGIYYDDRLTQEAPGWEYREGSRKLADVVNPTEELLDIYIKALEIYKDAKMGFIPAEKLAVVYIPCPWRPNYLLTKSPKSTKISPEEKNQMRQLLVQAVQEKFDESTDALEQTLAAFSGFSPRELELVHNPITEQTRSQLITEYVAEAKKWRAALDWAKALS